METTSLSIHQIAEEVGFNDISGFRSSFKKYTNQTPTDFLKNNGKAG